MTNSYYQKIKEKLSKKTYQNLSKGEKDKNRQYAREQYRKLSEEEKEKKCQYGREQYKNLLKDEYIKIFSRMQKIKTS